VRDAILAFKVHTLMAHRSSGQRRTQRTIYTAQAGRPHEFLTEPRWQDTGESIVIVAPA
jgi:hypothetical protein